MTLLYTIERWVSVGRAMVTMYWVLRRVLRKVFRWGIAVRGTMTKRMAVVVGVVALRGLAPGQGSWGRGLGSGLGWVGAVAGEVPVLVAAVAAAAATGLGACGLRGSGLWGLRAWARDLR